MLKRIQIAFPCLLSEEEREGLMISRQIDARLKQKRNEVQLFLLGTGESGKSTFIKQMRIIHGVGYTAEDKRGFVLLIYQNILMAMQTIIKAMVDLKIDYSNLECVEFVELVAGLKIDNLVVLEDSHLTAFKQLWADNGVQECYVRRNEYQLLDSTKYFMTEINRIASPDYLPTEQDILRVRVPTSGVVDYIFDLKRTRFRMVDVGGQRSERKKWIHLFENVTTILFLVALSEYDQCLFESENENRLEESKKLFENILLCPWFYEKPTVLFLNKTDLLDEKIVTSHLEDYFPEYTGPKQDAIAARAFILDMFTSLDAAKNKIIYSHFTCATDTKNISVIFDVVKETIIRENIGLMNLM